MIRAKTYPSEFSFGPRSRIRYVPTGERRPPRAGEFYLSGAIPMAYRSPGGMDYPYLIMRPATDAETNCPHCGQRLPE